VSPEAITAPWLMKKMEKPFVVIINVVHNGSTSEETAHKEM